MLCLFRNLIFMSRRLRYEPASPTRTFGSWVRIPLEAWISACVYFVFVLSCVQLAALRKDDPPSKETCQLRKKIKKLKKQPRSTRAVEPWIDERMDINLASAIENLDMLPIHSIIWVEKRCLRIFCMVVFFVTSYHN
jgi:hypothetical protein